MRSASRRCIVATSSLALGALGCTNMLDFFHDEPRPLGPGGEWRLTLGEECERPLDTAIWNTYWSTGGVEHRVMSHTFEYSADENVTVRDGTCAIKAEPEPQAGLAYTSGTLNTSAKFEQLYGFFEARVRAAPGQGLWSMFWLRSAAEWPPSVDVMNALGSRTTASAGYWREEASARAGDTFTYETLNDAPSSFHVYGVEWSAGELVYYLDGVEQHRIGGGVSPPAVPLHPTVNLYVGNADTPYAPDETTIWPSELAIDWIRVYERVP